MRALILAAGRGTRLSPLTNDKPKSLVRIGGRSLIERQIEILRGAGISRIAVVRGYRASQIDFPGLTYFENPEYDATNMVWTLFCAEPWFEDDLIIAYADILYEARLVDSLLRDDSPLSVIVDRDWRTFFERRGDDIWEHAESLRLDEWGHIVDIGRSAPDPADVEGQYIGLLRVSRETLVEWVDFWRRVRACGDDVVWMRGRSPRKAYMTDFLQACIDAGQVIRPIFVSGGWVELDTPRDLPLVEEWVRERTWYPSGEPTHQIVSGGP